MVEEQTVRAVVEEERARAEKALRSMNARPLVIDDYDTFVELRCEVEKLEARVREVAERFGVGDPGAATAAELVLEMRHAVDSYDEDAAERSWEARQDLLAS